jgi:5'-nucleotidase
VVTNDDGIGSEGLLALAQACASTGLEVVVAAPDGEASGTSAAMTANMSAGHVKVKRAEIGGLPGYAVGAYPAFIAFTALRGAFGPPPGLLVSGINLGPNTGRAVLHSGTVGAAMTAANSGVQAAAFSLDVRSVAEERHWATAAGVAREVLPALRSLPRGVLLNVNVPNVPADRLAGIRAARLGDVATVEVTVTEEGQDSLRVGIREATGEPAADSDSALLAAGYATVTPLRSVCEGALTVLPWPPGRV